MKLMAFVTLAAAASLIPAEPALACPSAPPGYVPPTEQEHLRRFVSDAPEIVYGVVTGTAKPGERTRLKILHVYKGAARKGQVVEAYPGHDYPVPFCAGMMAPPQSKSARDVGSVRSPEQRVGA